jgi:hypothetical protein
MKHAQSAGVGAEQLHDARAMVADSLGVCSPLRIRSSTVRSSTPACLASSVSSERGFSSRMTVERLDALRSKMTGSFSREHATTLSSACSAGSNSIQLRDSNRLRARSG